MAEAVAVIATDIAFWQPGFGSHRRIEQICHTFARFFTVKVLVFQAMTEEARQVIAQRRYPFEIVFHQQYQDQPERALHTTLESIHPSLQPWYMPAWHQAFHAFVDELQPAVVVTEYLRMQYLIREISPDIVTVLDSHDVLSLRGISFASFGEASGTFLSLEEERALMNSYTFALAISQPDYAWMCHVIRPGSAVFMPFMPALDDLPRPAGGSTSRLIFAGANSPANVQALRWFLGQVFPYLPTRITLSVYGNVGRSVQADDRVRVHGVVENVADIYSEFGVAINPVFFGGGLKIKSLEALWAGLPLVASAEGARGTEQFAGKGFSIAHSRTEFFDQICAVSRMELSAGALLEQRAGLFATYRAEAEAVPFMTILRQLTRDSSRWMRPRLTTAA
jgi:glycosyltransferase involved in cell wall biosynthesis